MCHQLAEILVDFGSNFDEIQHTRVHQINDAGVAALGWIDSAGNEEGGLYENASATYITVNVPNSALTGVEGINDSDTLVGIFATPTDSVYESFIATGKP